MTEVPENAEFLGSEIAPVAPADARFHVIPVPYERSTSYGSGTCNGPAAILRASWQLELWDGRSRPGDDGIFTKAPIDCAGAADAVLARVAASVRDSLALGRIPIAIGGEHTVTWGVIQGYLQAGITDFGVVQIDAHADLRDRYEDNPLSHASVMRRVVDAGIPLFQLGIRAYCEEEIETRRRFGVGYRDADELVPRQIDHIVLPDTFPRQVFFTLDVDGLDPSVFPGTGTPVPGGLGWYQTLALFESIARQRAIIGFDVMEFTPIPGFHAYDFAAALLIYKLMGILQRTPPAA